MLLWRHAYHVARCLCDKLFECLWVKVGLSELETLVEIRVLAYLRVANSKAFFQDKRICNVYFEIRQSSLYLFAVRIT